MEVRLNQQICNALLNTLSNSPSIIKQAEDFLIQLEQVPGFVLTLFQLIGTTDLDLGTRQAGAIYFKHLVHKYWNEDKPEGALFSVETKEIIRKNLFFCIASSPRSIELQLGEVLYDILQVDYPDNWGSLITDILELINSQDPVRIRCALYILCVVTRRYEYSSPFCVNNKRVHLHYIVDATFPVLIKLFEYIVTKNTPQSIEMELFLTKIFWSSTQFGIPPYLLGQNKFNEWLQIFVHILNRPISTELEPEDIEEKENWEPWHVKKLIAKIFERFISRFVVPHKRDSEFNKTFCEIFMNNYLIQLLVTIMNFLGGDTAVRSPHKFITYLLDCVSYCVFYSKTWLVIKPHLDTLVKSIFLPILTFSKLDINIFEEDPHEFLRLEYDLNQDFINPRSSVITFMGNVIRHRGDKYLSKFVDPFLQLLHSYAMSPPQFKNPGEKYASLIVIGNLSIILLKSQVYKNTMEELLTLHIFPELQSPIGFLRARAIWTFGKFNRLKYKNLDNFYNAFKITLNSISDKILPVSVFSALAFQQFLKKENVRSLIEPIVPQLLEQYINLINHVENDNLVGGLSTFIEAFPDKTLQYIPEITNKLVEHYLKCIRKGDLFDDKDQSAYLVVMEILSVIIIILKNTQNVPGMYAKLEPIMLPVLSNVSEELIDFFIDYIEILTYFTYYENISDDLWQVFGKYIDIYFEWGSEFLEDLLRPFDNFISKNPEKFLASPYLEKVCNIYKNALSPNSGENDGVVACSLMEVVLVYCRGRVDGIVPTVIDLAVNRLECAKFDHLKVALIGIIANSLYYNPQITLFHLESKKIIPQIFTLWFQLLTKSIRSRHEIKLSILGFSAILHLPFSNWPLVIQNQVRTLVTAIMELCHKSISFKDDNKSSSENSYDSDDESDDQDNDELDDFQDKNDEIKAIKRNIKELKKKVYDDNEDIASDILNGEIFGQLAALYNEECSDSTIEDDYDFSSLIDETDDLIFFLNAFQIFSKRDSEVYQQKVISTFTPDEEMKFQQLLDEGNKRRNV